MPGIGKPNRVSQGTEHNADGRLRGKHGLIAPFIAQVRAALLNKGMRTPTRRYMEANVD